jgi:hypothetical protein
MVGCDDFTNRELPGAPRSARTRIPRKCLTLPTLLERRCFASLRNVFSPRCGRQRLTFVQAVFRRSLKFRYDLSLTQRASGGRPLSRVAAKVHVFNERHVNRLEQRLIAAFEGGTRASGVMLMVQ